MIRHFAKLMLPFAMVVITLFGLAGQAHAQTTWSPPSFDRDRHVYLDPRLAEHNTFPVNFDGLEKALVERGRKHNLQIYVVAAELGSEAVPQDHNWAIDKLNDLVLRWQSQPAFPHDDYMIVLWVRRTDNPNKGHVAANGGNRLQKYGYTASRMSDPTDGPVMPALRQYMPNDPKGAMIAIADNVNAGVDKYVADEEAARQHAEFMKKLPGYIAIGVVSLALLGLLIWLFLRYRREKGAILKVLASWQERLDSANAQYIKLHEGYFGFIKDQGDWSNKFKGETHEKYKAAVTDFADFTARQKAANNLLDTAKKYVSKSIWPMVGGFRKANAMLTIETVTITGKELSLEESTLFGGVVTKVDYAPEKLLDAMSELFDRTNKALASIVASFRGAEENRQDIDRLLGEVDAKKAALTEAGLSFDPYQERYTKVKSGQAAFAAILASDPLTAYTASEHVEADAKAIKADLDRALSIKGELTTVETAIAKAITHSRTVRDQQIGYAYPLDGAEKAPGGVATQLFTLSEEGGNPDPLVEEAGAHLKTALAAVLAGELDKSDKEKAAAIAAAQRADKLVDAVVEAKAFVEKDVPAVRTNLGKLQAAIANAEQAVAELKSDFLATNYPGEAEKLGIAKAVIDATAAELAKVKNAYDEQRYVASRKKLEELGGDIQGSRDGLVEIHARLTKLRQLRQHSRDLVVVCQEQAGTLKTKLATDAFTTSAATDSEYDRLLPLLAAQQKDVKKDVTDWPAAAEAADRLTAAFKAVDAAIDQQRLDHQRATEKVSAAVQSVSDAGRYVSDADTRQPARTQLDEATAALSRVQSAIMHAKADWAALGRQADEVDSLADKARGLAQADKRAADEARASIARAESNIRSVDRSYGHGVTADLGSARSHLSQARSELSARDYEQADRSADAAYRAAEQAESSAQSRVAAIVAEIERQRREEERRRREAEEARRREEESRRSSSSGGGGYSGRSGGGSVGGGRSGGGSY